MSTASKRILLMCVVLGVCGTRISIGQDLSGRVLDERNKPLQDVTVTIETLQMGQVTDLDGRFTLGPLPEGTFLVNFRYVGYVLERRTVSISDRSVHLDVTLLPAVIESEGVTVTDVSDARDILTRSQQSVSVLEGKRLDDVRGQTLGETLEKLPGVRSLSTGPSISKPVIRGLHSQRIIILNAGVPLEGQQWGGDHGPEIDPFSQSRIEVIKGAAGVEYGVGALGGAIRLEAPPLPTRPGVSGRLTLNGFSNNLQGAGALALEGGVAGVEGFGWRIQGSFREARDASAPDYVITNSAFRESDGRISLGYLGDRLELKGVFSHYDTELGIYSGSHIGNLSGLLDAIARGRPPQVVRANYAIDAPKQEIRHDLISLQSILHLTSGDRLEIQYGFQNNRRKEFDVPFLRRSEVRPGFDMKLQTHTLETRLRFRPRGRLFGTIGLSGMNQANFNIEPGFLIPNFRAVTGSGFARGSFVNEGFSIEAGLRYDYRWMRVFPFDKKKDRFSRRIHRFSNVSGVTGATYRFASSWSISANLGTGWRPPGVNELYSNGLHHGTAQVEIGDASLVGERSLDLNTTLRHADDRLTFELSAFRNRIDNYLYLIPDPSPTITLRGVFPTFRYQQNDAELTGLDGYLDFKLTPRLLFGGQASVLRADNLVTSEPIFGMPSDRIVIHSQISLPDSRSFQDSFLDIEAQFISKQDRVPANVDYAPPPDGYTIINAQLGAELNVGTAPLRLSLSVRNVFNERYRDFLSRFRYFIDEPGRNIVLRLQIPFGSTQ